MWTTADISDKGGVDQSDTMTKILLSSVISNGLEVTWHLGKADRFTTWQKENIASLLTLSKTTKDSQRVKQPISSSQWNSSLGLVTWQTTRTKTKTLQSQGYCRACLWLLAQRFVLASSQKGFELHSVTSAHFIAERRITHSKYFSYLWTYRGTSKVNIIQCGMQKFPGP